MKASSQLRNLPGVDKIISDKRLAELRQVYSHETTVEVTRRYLDELRSSLLEGKIPPDFEKIVDSVIAEIESLGTVGPRPVINATGVIIHTNLGRAPLSAEAIAAMKPSSEGFTNLELDLVSGKRGSRNVHVEDLLCHLTGAEDALVVNNNASGVLLALSALARRKEVVVSRGHAVEIGGKFRIPDVMRQSGAKLVEVGTTNKTYISDYEEVITDRTAALLHVHLSNFRVVGFTEEVSIEELTKLGRRYEVTVLNDLGSGCLLDTTEFGLAAEPRVQDSIATGVGLAMFSGDKLLGGPQAGIIVGEKQLMAKLKKHPLARAARIDKTRLAALSATLVHYLKGEATAKIPVWQMIATPLSEIEQRAKIWADEIGSRATVREGESTIGGGSLPGGTLPTRLVVVEPKDKVQILARQLRQQPLPIIGRVEKNTLALDPRSVLPPEDPILLRILKSVL
ncbi:MAG: L-seryl-tRNA(Sec) selenium transferase [Dehalococcoidia bacterium]